MLTHKSFLLPLITAYTLILPQIIVAGMVADFGSSWYVNESENRLETTTDPLLWNTPDTGHAIQTMTISNEIGADGKPGFNRNFITAYGTDGNYKTYILYFNDRYTIASKYTQNNANRMVLYARIPDGEFEFHLGTYSQDPASTSSQLGAHFYHWFNLKGNNNKYWTKIIMNRHPQNEVGVDARPPNNPTLSKYGWEYFAGMKRIYFQMKYSEWPGQWKPYVVDIDNVEFYREDREENVYSINGLSVTYFGNGEFIINWQSYGLFGASHVNDRFKIRYSVTGPINTETDWENATPVPGEPADGWGRRDKTSTTDPSMRAHFIINPIDENKTFYFAVRDMDPAHPELTRISYKIIGATSKLLPEIENITIK